MFQYMVSSLRHNNIPDEKILTARLHIALIKKEGVLKIPYLMRSSDPKINPLSKHLLWAAILTRDQNAVERVLALLAWEKSDTKKEFLSAKVLYSITVEYLDEFLHLPTAQACRNHLKSLLNQLPTITQD